MTHGKPNGLSIHHTRGRTRVTLRKATIWTHTGTLAQAARQWTVEGVETHGRCRWWTIRDLFLTFPL
jgi:microcystin-dependent protein